MLTTFSSRIVFFQSQPAIPLPDRPLTRPEERVVNCQVCSKPLKIRLDSEIRDHLIQRHAPMVARAIGGAGNDPVLLWVRKCCIDEVHFGQVYFKRCPFQAPDSTQLTTTGRRKRTAVNPVPAMYVHLSPNAIDLTVQMPRLSGLPQRNV